MQKLEVSEEFDSSRTSFWLRFDTVAIVGSPAGTTATELLEVCAHVDLRQSVLHIITGVLSIADVSRCDVAS